MTQKQNGQSRVVIEDVRPQVDGGEFPIKRVVGQSVAVEANIFADGHDVVVAVVRYRSERDAEWSEVAMTPLVNDEWEAEFFVGEEGVYCYTVQAWIDRFKTWHRDLHKRAIANQVTRVDLTIGAELLEAAATKVTGSEAERLTHWGRRLRQPDAIAHIEQICDDSELSLLMDRHAPRDFATTYQRELRVTVDRVRAGFSAWYECFPRSCADSPGKHGTLKDVESRLPYVAAMGFDVLYLPPIHPVGTQFRKGKNNAEEAQEGDVGSPWGIGAAEGGHKSIHPQLGTMDDFKHLLLAAREHGIEIAMDIAFQCAPDHPYVKAHPQWFRQRPDGTIQYAENPPKKYQDIYPFDFETPDWERCGTS